MPGQLREHLGGFAQRFGLLDAQLIAEAGQLLWLDEQGGTRRARAEHDTGHTQVCVRTHGQHVAPFALGVVVGLHDVGVTLDQLAELPFQLFAQLSGALSSPR